MKMIYFCLLLVLAGCTTQDNSSANRLDDASQSMGTIQISTDNSIRCYDDSVLTVEGLIEHARLIVIVEVADVRTEKNGDIILDVQVIRQLYGEPLKTALRIHDVSSGNANAEAVLPGNRYLYFLVQSANSKSEEQIYVPYGYEYAVFKQAGKTTTYRNELSHQPAITISQLEQALGRTDFPELQVSTATSSLQDWSLEYMVSVSDNTIYRMGNSYQIYRKERGQWVLQELNYVFTFVLVHVNQAHPYSNAVLSGGLVTGDYMLEVVMYPSDNPIAIKSYALFTVTS